VLTPVPEADLLGSVVEPTWPRAPRLPRKPELASPRPKGKLGPRRPITVPDPILLEAEVEERQSRWDQGVSKLIALMSGVSALAVLSAWEHAGREAGQALFLLTVISGLYFALHWRMSLAGVLRDRPWIHAATALVEGVLPTVALYVVARFRGPEWALASPVFLTYPVLIAASGARLRPKLCLLTGGVATMGFVLLYYLALHPNLSVSTGALAPAVEPWGMWQRALLLALCCGVIAYATAKIRDLTANVATEMWQRRVLERELGRYVSKGVASAILSGENSFSAAARRDVTVLFCDLRDFTALCERQPPEQVVDMLNQFYERACRVVHRHGGTVNKFMGDGLLALFGAPDDHPDHVMAAAEAAHEIMYAADELRKQGGIWRTLDIGIGLDSGDVVVGDVGARNRAEYTAIGTTVNRAARLQGLSREADRRIVLSDVCAARLGPRANLVCLGSVKLKGLSTPIDVYAFRHSNRE